MDLIEKQTEIEDALRPLGIAVKFISVQQNLAQPVDVAVHIEFEENPGFRG